MKQVNFILRLLIVLMAVLILNSIISAQQKIKILIVYYSLTGTTEQMAIGVKEGVERDSNATATLKKVDEVTSKILNAVDGIVLGSPTYWGNISNPMKKFLDDIGFLGDKVGGAFATGAMKTGGKEHVVVSLLLALLMKGAIIVGPVYDFGAFQSGAFGASAMTGPPDNGVSELELEDARKLGERVATIAGQMKSGTAVNVKTHSRQLPKGFNLQQNFPNPFNPETKINYELPNRSRVLLKVFNELGEEVRTLVDKEQFAGKYQVQWDGRDNNYKHVATGVYFYQLSMEGAAQTKKMLLLR
ncbi:MAG: T9SS type A sorting domain-containing protein [Chlorobi bacterium]|nr:T9SS type A sorting domain-containing protein [Chlorobiota bacterium]